MIRKRGVAHLVTIVGMATLAFTLDGAASANDLARLYQRYFEAGDETKLQSLVYWAGVQEADREGFIRSVRFDLGHRLRSVKFVPLDRGEKLEYSKGGVVIRPSLPPVGRLVATYEGSGTLQRLTTSYLVGVKDYITWHHRPRSTEESPGAAQLGHVQSSGGDGCQ
jgi:hypothetical protein